MTLSAGTAICMPRPEAVGVTDAMIEAQFQSLLVIPTLAGPSHLGACRSYDRWNIPFWGLGEKPLAVRGIDCYLGRFLESWMP